MKLIGASTSDWRPDNPNIRPAVWFIPVICAVLIVIALAAVAGTWANGDGSPLLSTL